MKRDYLHKKNDRMAAIGFPDWLSRNCPCCGNMMSSGSMIGIGMELSPKTFGNVSTSYVCEHCSSLVELHYVRALADSVDLASFLSSGRPKVEPVTYEEIIMSKGHNLNDE